MIKAARLTVTAVCCAAVTAIAFNSAGAFDAAPDEHGAIRVAQLSAPDLVLRIERLEEENRRLTGLVEQLQYKNQQLEQQLRRVQGGAPAVPAEQQARAPEPEIRNPIPPEIRNPVPNAAVTQPPSVGEAPLGSSTPPPASVPGRRDAFDPTQNPNAPGAPRTLGSLSEPVPAGGVPAESGEIGAPGGRNAGAPLDLSSLSGHAAREPQTPAVTGIGPAASAVPSSPQNAYPPAVQTVMAPSATPRDEYDLAYGYVLHKDYALAEDSFRAFLKKYPGDRLVPDANYWLGESLFQRQRYRDAAESFLVVSTKYETASRAPDALLRLGQSLAALGEKDAACATFYEVGRKYPRGSLALKQGVEREEKRAGC